MATLTEIQTLINDPVLAEKVRAACIIAAKDINFEDPGTANHAARLAWAKEAFSDPNGMATKIARYVVAANGTSTLAEINALSDSVIQNHVNASLAIFAV